MRLAAIAPTHLSASALMLCLLLASFAPACGDDEPPANDGATNNGATNNGETNNGATNNGSTNNGATNNGGNNGTNNGATNNGATNNGDPIRPPCEEIEAADGDVAYDAYLLPPLDALVGRLQYTEATVRKTGARIEVLVEDDEPIVADFVDEDGLRHCVAYSELPALRLCFFKANGDPANDGALGATFRPEGNTIYAVVAHRKGMSRPCSVDGHYSLTATDVKVDEGDAAIGDVVVAELLDYLSIFVVEQDATVIMGDAPVSFEVDLVQRTGGFAGSLDDAYLTVDDTTEWDMSLSISGSFAPEEESGTVQLEATVTVSDPDGVFPDTTVSATLHGTRN